MERMVVCEKCVIFGTSGTITRISMKKIITVLGARPQFVKAFVVSRALKSSPGEGEVQEIWVHTGQHYDHDMSGAFFEEFSLPKPKYNLAVGSGSHAAQTGSMMMGLEKICVAEKPDLVLIYGDTNSTLAGALVAAKLGIPIAHVEAGLRSFKKTMPEEINRVVADSLSKLLFCPTQTAVINLKNEGIINGVFLTGDVMFDAVKISLSGVREMPPEAFALATVHREENTESKQNLEDILRGFAHIHEQVLPVTLLLHPRTKKAIEQWSLGDYLHKINVLSPLSYRETLSLIQRSRLVLTDSGGLQKEAFFLKTPCVTLRDETEWVETVESGWNTLAGSDFDKIINSAKEFFQRDQSKVMADSNLYGDGNSATLISKIILDNI